MSNNLLIAIFQIDTAERMFCILLAKLYWYWQKYRLAHLEQGASEQRKTSSLVILYPPEYIEPETGSDTASDTDRPIQIVTGRKQLHRRVDIAVDLRNFVHAV